METIHRVLDLVMQVPTKFFVDIGASCDFELSQTELLAHRGWSGVMIECDPEKCRVLESRLKGLPVTVVRERATPENVVGILARHRVPHVFYMSLDIDGYDYFVLREVLKSHAPQVVVSEINEKIPPPVRFAVRYSPDYCWDGSHYYGYSLAMLDELLPSLGYRIERLDWNNVVLVPGRHLGGCAGKYRDGYLHRPGREAKFHYNQDFDIVHLFPRSLQLEFIRKKFDPLCNERQRVRGRQLDGTPVLRRNFILE